MRFQPLMAPATPPPRKSRISAAAHHLKHFLAPKAAMSKQPFHPEDLEVLRQVGRGSFGRVYCARVRFRGRADNLYLH